MKNKTTYLLLGLLVALVGAYFAFVHKWHGPDNEFHITDPKEVGSIEIEKMEMNASKEKVSLTLDGDQWMVDGKYTASAEKMQEFLTTLMEIRVVQPVEPKAQGSALSLLKRNHIHVRVADRDGGTLKDYLIGATNSAQTANIFKMDYSDQCYMVSKPALEGYVSVYYSTKANDWREKLLWNVTEGELQSVSVTYFPDSLQYSYQLARSGEQWTVGQGLKADPGRAKAYAAMFTGKVFAESFADAAFPGMLDSLKRRSPQAKVAVKGKAGAVVLNLFTRPENQESYFAYLDGKDELLTVQHFVIDKFLKTSGYFYAPIP